MGEREMSQNKSLQSKMPLAMGLCVRRIYHTVRRRIRIRSADLSVLYQLRYLVSDPAGSDTGIVCTVFLVWNALCL